MNPPTDPQQNGASDFAPPSLADAVRTDPQSPRQRIRDALGRDRVGVAVGLLRRMLAADQGILLQRISRAERRRLIPLLPRRELSDILDEAPTPAAASIVRELTPEQAANLLDDVDSHTVADILQELPDARADAIVEELERPQDVVPLLEYPPDTAGGMMTTDYPRVRHDVSAGNCLGGLRDHLYRRVRIPHISGGRRLPGGGAGVTRSLNPSLNSPCQKTRGSFTIAIWRMP